MKKGVQYFTKEYLKQCADLTPDQVIEFLENYRNLMPNKPDLNSKHTKISFFLSKYFVVVWTFGDIWTTKEMPMIAKFEN